MSRDIPAALLANISDSVIYPFFAVELLFDGDNVLRLWNGQGILNYNGNEWVGSGDLLTISTIEETSEIAVRGATLTLSGVPTEVLSLALSEPYQGRVCNIYFGLFDKATQETYKANGLQADLVLDFENRFYAFDNDYGGQDTLGYGVANLTEIFTGYMDRMDIQEGADTCTVELQVENRLIDLERARVARFNSGYQKSIYPNDLGLDFVESLQNRPISWGKKTDNSFVTRVKNTSSKF